MQVGGGPSVQQRRAEPDADVFLTIQEASRLLQVPAPTIRSWERRYGVPVPGRSHGGHRRYTPEQLQMLQRMRDEISRGRRAVEAAALVKAAQTESMNPLVAAFLQAAQRFDPSGIEQTLDAACRELGLGRTVDEVLLPAMREIGRRWEAGRCDVAHEHLATGATQAWLTTITRSAAISRQHRPVLLSCGPRDHHTLALEAMAALLLDAGLDCRLLGARVPVTSLLRAVKETNPAAVILVSHLAVARRSAVEALRSLPVHDTTLFYAGNAFLSPQSRRGVPGTYLGDNLSNATSMIIEAVTAPTVPAAAGRAPRSIPGRSSAAAVR
jgi:DNA-binding transcriptional MerR regulator/methylmalonyl-CoA mutase cobalamin-binding subunit